MLLHWVEVPGTRMNSKGREAHGYITRKDGLEAWLFDKKEWSTTHYQSMPWSECERAMRDDIPVADGAKINGDYNDEFFDE